MTDVSKLELMNKLYLSQRPYTPPDKVATVWAENGRFVQICFQSRGCRYSGSGSCIMCDYGRGGNLSEREVWEYCFTSPLFDDCGISELLLGSYGSILDEYEISRECFQVILRRLSDSPIPVIGFETRCETVTREKLREIQTYLPDKEIYIEMGLESLDDRVREKYLRKRMSISSLQKAMDVIRKAGFLSVLNIMLGSPFLTPREQVEDVVQSAKWAFEEGAESIVLFPVNVKPYTLLYTLMTLGMYVPVSLWRVIATLYALSGELTPDQLAHVGLSWYGERDDIYPAGSPRMISPYSCDKCRNMLLAFCKDFLAVNSGEKRKTMLQDLMTRDLDCQCRRREIDLLEHAESCLSGYDYIDMIGSLKT